MTDQEQASGRPAVAAGRLWAGGLATAIVAILVAVVGIVISRGIFDVQVLEPQGEGVWVFASTWWYATVAAILAVVATGLAHLLLLFTPRPMSFFGWIVALATAVAVLAPFASDAALESKVATGLINLAIGVAIGTLLTGVASSATRRSPPAQTA